MIFLKRKFGLLRGTLLPVISVRSRYNCPTKALDPSVAFQAVQRARLLSTVESFCGPPGDFFFPYLAGSFKTPSATFRERRSLVAILRLLQSATCRPKMMHFSSSASDLPLTTFSYPHGYPRKKVHWTYGPLASVWPAAVLEGSCLLLRSWNFAKIFVLYDWR